MSDGGYYTDWSDEAKAKGADLWDERTENGEAELAICAECGVWTRWDSDVTNYGTCFDGRDHRVTRVRVARISKSYALTSLPPSIAEKYPRRDDETRAEYVRRVAPLVERDGWSSA